MFHSIKWIKQKTNRKKQTKNKNEPDCALHVGRARPNFFRRLSTGQPQKNSGCPKNIQVVPTYRSMFIFV